jgi:hypothetical protein
MILLLFIEGIPEIRIFGKQAGKKVVDTRNILFEPLLLGKDRHELSIVHGRDLL